MNEKKQTKKALIMSVTSMVLCVAMLVGMTFAWFTDTASTAVNKIQAGTLDIDLLMSTDGGASWSDADGHTLNFMKKNADGTLTQDENVLWEPGATFVLPRLKIVNKGNLALKYKVVISGAAGNTELLDVIKFTANKDNVQNDIRNGSEIVNGTFTATGDSKVIDISAKMDENAGNKYKGMTLSGVAITVYATQLNYEYDSNGNVYDENAQYPTAVTTAEDLKTTVNSATEPVSIKLANNITTDDFVIPSDKNVTIDLNGWKISNAASHTILNKGHLTLKDSSAKKSGEIVSLKANTSALRNGDNAVCVIEGGTFSRDGANGNTWHVIENFGAMTFNGGKVVLKSGNGFAITNGWNYINPGASTTPAKMIINALELETDSSGIKNCRYGELTVNNVNVECTGFWSLSNDYLGTAVINGGNFKSTNFKAVSNGANMTVNGGIFDGGENAGLFIQSYATSTVLNGGRFTNMNKDAISSYVGTGHTAGQDGTSVIIK